MFFDASFHQGRRIWVAPLDPQKGSKGAPPRAVRRFGTLGDDATGPPALDLTGEEVIEGSQVDRRDSTIGSFASSTCLLTRATEEARIRCCTAPTVENRGREGQGGGGEVFVRGLGTLGDDA